MNHWRAKRLLAALPDGSLAPEVEFQVRAHVDVCKGCARRLADFELAEELLGRIPISVAPLEFNPGAHRRLASLARWSEEPALPRPQRWTGPALSLAGIVATTLLALTIRTWSPILADNTPVAMAMMPQNTVALPVGWRPGK